MPIVVYAIECVKNGFTYVGYSANPMRRYSEHRRKLRKGIHSQRNMSADWRKYGRHGFKMSILEILPHDTDVPEAHEAELRWQGRFAQLGRLYNERKCSLCGSPIRDDASATVELDAADGIEAGHESAAGDVRGRPAGNAEPSEATDRQPRRPRAVKDDRTKRSGPKID